MRVARLHMTSAVVAELLGARRQPPIAPFIEIVPPCGSKLYWPVDPLAFKEQAA